MLEELIELGYRGDIISLSRIIDWIRIEKKFNIWVEHGNKKSHDVTTDLGCHRGSFGTYEDAQVEGIKIFLKHGSK
jgi:hypothetical protein